MERITRENLEKAVGVAAALTGRKYTIESNEIGYQVSMLSEHNTGTTLDVTTYGTKREVWDQVQAFIRGLRYASS